MDVNERIKKILILEKMNNYPGYSKKLGLKEVSNNKKVERKKHGNN